MELFIRELHYWSFFVASCTAEVTWFWMALSYDGWYDWIKCYASSDGKHNSYNNIPGRAVLLLFVVLTLCYFIMFLLVGTHAACTLSGSKWIVLFLRKKCRLQQYMVYFKSCVVLCLGNFHADFHNTCHFFPRIHFTFYYLSLQS